MKLEKNSYFCTQNSKIMQFVITAYDGEGMLAKRMEVRPLHFEGMEKMRKHLISAGGMLDEEGNLKGSVLIMEFDNREELDAYLSNEIYVKERVWDKITIERMNVAYALGERYDNNK